MDKILQTQFKHILNGLHKQEEEIEMAARLLAQANYGEGKVYIRGFGDFELLESYLVESEHALPGAEAFPGIAPIGTADRVLVLSKFADEPLSVFLRELDEVGIDYVLICNRKGESSEDFVDFASVHHFIDLASPREVMPTPDFDRIVNPYMMAFMYLYYQIFALIKEMGD